MTNEQRLAIAKKYGKGTQVRIDYLTHTIPAKIIEITEVGYGWKALSGRIICKVTEDAGLYIKGQILTVSAFECVPAAQYRRHGKYGLRVNVNYILE
jgi:hypothetical protein